MMDHSFLKHCLPDVWKWERGGRAPTPHEGKDGKKESLEVIYLLLEEEEEEAV